MHGEDNCRCPLDGWHALGLMSGTSLDGLDVASVRFFQDQKTRAWSFALKSFSTLAYPDVLRDQLWRAMDASAEDLMRLDHDWAHWAGQEVMRWMKDSEISVPHVVGSHGHTIFHFLPRRFDKIGFVAPIHGLYVISHFCGVVVQAMCATLVLQCNEVQIKFI